MHSNPYIVKAEKMIDFPEELWYLFVLPEPNKEENTMSVIEELWKGTSVPTGQPAYLSDEIKMELCRFLPLAAYKPASMTFSISSRSGMASLYLRMLRRLFIASIISSPRNIEITV